MAAAPAARFSPSLFYGACLKPDRLKGPLQKLLTLPEFTLKSHPL